MITLVILKNPFNQDKEIKQINHIPGQSVFAYVQPATMGHDEIVISRNGCIVPEEEYDSLVLVPGDFIAVCPVIEGEGTGKDIARAIATIAVIAASMWTGGATLAAGWGFWSYVATASVQLVGGMLINKWFPYEQEKQEDPSYRWGQLPPVSTEGNAVPITFGTVRMGVMAPIQVLSQRITTDGKKQYLNLLLSGGEGAIDAVSWMPDPWGFGIPIPVPGAAISDIRINDQPLKNYGSAVQIARRNGTNEQTVISGFDETAENLNVMVELKEGQDWTTRQTVGNAGQALNIILECPMGLWGKNRDGSLHKAHVTVSAEYRKVGDTTWRTYPYAQALGASRARTYDIYVHVPVSQLDGVSQVEMKYGGQIKSTTITQVSGVMSELTKLTVTDEVPYDISAVIIKKSTISISENTTKPMRREFRIDGLEPAQYEVRCKCISKGTGSAGQETTVYWSALENILIDDFVYPNQVLLAIRALATDQLSGGMPRISWLQTRSKVLVWNPSTAKHEEKNANNPAWACYDLIHRCKSLKNINTELYEYIVEGVNANRIDYQSFVDWATYCDERELYFNGVIYQTSNMWDALRPPEAAGRGKVLLRGTRYSCTCDAPSQPVQLFNVSNIALDSFREEFLGQADRANALEITFYNIDKDYQEDMIVVYGDGYDEAAAIQNPTQIRVPYAMTLAQAYRAGKYQLRLNQYLIRAVSWEADIDAIACQVGDVVLVQHDVPQWGIGGRVVEATKTTVKLDQEVTLEAGKEYAVLIRLADDTLVEKSVAHVTEATITDTITIIEAFTDAPQPDDIFSFGEIEKVAKPFRLTHVSRDGDLRRQLVALEYNEAVYQEADEIPEIDYRLPVPQIRNLMANETMLASGDIQVNISWLYPDTLVLSGVKIYVDGENVGRVNANESAFSLVLEEGTYVFTVTASDTFGKELTSDSIEYTVKGIELPTDDGEVLIDENTYQLKDGTVLSDIWVDIVAEPYIAFSHYNIYYDLNYSGKWIYAGFAVEGKYIIKALPQAQVIRIKVTTVTTFGYESAGAISAPYVVVGKDRPPSDVEKLTLTQIGGNIKAVITPVPEPDIRGYELRMGPSWGNSLFIKSIDQVYTEFEAPNEGSLTFWVKAVDNSYNYSLNATKAQINVFGLPPKNIIFEREEDTRTWTAKNGSMYFDPWNRWKIQSKKKVREYPRFFDMFGQPIEYVDDPELYLPVADLGPNIIEEGYFWIDRFGETHLNSVKKLEDFERFFDVFGIEHPLVEPKYATTTLMGISIDYNQTPTNRIDIEYRTRVDGDGWTDWKTYLEKTFFGRRIEVKLKPMTGNGDNVVISGGRMIVDVPDVEEIIENIDIPAEKTRIVFRRKFFDPPKSIAVFAADETGKQAIWRIDPESITRDGFDLELLDDEGNLIAGKLLRASVRGY